MTAIASFPRPLLPVAAASADLPVMRTRALSLLTPPRLRRVTLINAPAGYGKSMLLEQLQVLLEQLGYHCLRRSRTPAAQLAAELSALVQVADTRPVCCFIDDALASDDLQSLLATALPRLHFIIASRQKLTLPRARLRLEEQVTEINAQALAFSSEETREYLARRGTSATLEQTAAWQAKTEGWIAGLKLGLLSPASTPGSDGATSYPSGQQLWLHDYFEEELLAQHSAEVRSFLTHIGVVGRCTAGLCDALRGSTGSQDLLDYCEQNGLFLFSTDGKRQEYRLHTLAAEFLHRRLQDQDPRTVRVIHRRASEWFWAQQQPLEAFEHAVLADDMDWAARIVDMSCTVPTSVAQRMLVLQLAERIPEGVRAQYPNMIHALAWPLLCSWQFDRTRALLRTSSARIAELRQSRTLTAQDIARLEATQQHRSMMLTQFQDDPLLAERQCLALMELAADLDGFVIGSLHTSLLNTRRAQYKIADVEHHDARAREQFQRFGAELVATHEVVMGQLHFLGGKPDAAIARMEEALDSVTVLAPHLSHSWGASVALPLAEMHYEHNELGKARRLVDLYLPHGNEFGTVDQLIAGFMTQARLQLQRCDTAAAFETLDTAASIATHRGFERLGLQACALRVRLLLVDGKRSAALLAAGDANIRLATAPKPPARPLTGCDEIRAQIWVRLARNSPHTSQALRLPRSWVTFLSNARATHAMVRWQLTVAELLMDAGQILAAQRVLRRAVNSAAPGRYLRSFVDAGPLIGALLRQQVAAEADTRQEPPMPFAAELLAILDREPGTLTLPPAEPAIEAQVVADYLDGREREVLALAGMGLRNADIGNRLGMTEASVKWYMRKVFDKIGVRKRSQAVQRARHIGLIH